MLLHHSSHLVELRRDDPDEDDEDDEANDGQDHLLLAGLVLMKTKNKNLKTRELNSCKN